MQTETPLHLSYVPYRDDVEIIEDNEPELIQKIIDAMSKGAGINREKFGKSVRTSHAKAHGLLKGQLIVRPDLPEYLRQGLFAFARTYDVIARLAQVPGDFEDDRKVSAPRGFSFKVLGVEGLKVAGHEASTQDFVLDTGKIFNALGLKTFYSQIAPLEQTAPRLPEALKGAVSAVSLATNKALNAIGANSSALDFFGHPFLHPLAEPSYSQAPIRYGDYIAKLNVMPATARLRALLDEKFEPQDFDGLRTATVAFFQANPAEFDIGIQLCTDLETMPVENPNMEWPEEQSPYQPVARLVFPAQDAYSPMRQKFVDEGLLFCPSHSLAAHRPLGSIMRARMAAYEALGNRRRADNGITPREPRDISEMPE